MTISEENKFLYLLLRIRILCVHVLA
uniref:Uncharacterized protein n=1 Tax=Arundo donax TaxID=35708 RepID=A0A0A8YDA8_ARUDO